MLKSLLTNGLLGIITLCLLLNVFIQLGLFPKASAGSNAPNRALAPTEVVIVGIKEEGISPRVRPTNGTLPVNVTLVDNKRLSAATPLRTTEIK